MNRERMKTIGAICLIVLGILLLMFWEGFGRNQLLNEEVIVAAEDISAGTVLQETMFKEMHVEKELLVPKGYQKGEIKQLAGQRVKQYIPTNAQMNQEMLVKDNLYLMENESIYKIPAEWIDSRSASVRRGDQVGFYTKDGIERGVFRIAFVKDQEEREVTSTESQWAADALERTDSTGIISNIEIIATLESYKALKEMAEEQGEVFLIVQKFGGGK